MNPDAGDSTGAEQDTEQPIRGLMEQERDTAPDFLARVRNRIQRRQTVSQGRFLFLGNAKAGPARTGSHALTKVRFDTLVGKAGLDRALQRIGIRQELTIQIPRLVYFLVLLVLAKTAVDALGLVAISDATGHFFAYLPNIVAAGQQGVLRAITATHVIFESEGHETAISNETFLDQIAKQ